MHGSDWVADLKRLPASLWLVKQKPSPIAKWLRRMTSWRQAIAQVYVLPSARKLRSLSDLAMWRQLTIPWSRGSR